MFAYGEIGIPTLRRDSMDRALGGVYPAPLYAPVAQLDSPALFYASVAQWIEHLASDQGVAGSTPAGCTILRFY